MASRFRPEALVGTELGRYHVLQHLGSGGIAHVYVAEPRANRTRASRVALKLLRPEHQKRSLLVARFEREATAAGRVRHPNVVEVGPLERTDDGHAFFTMELLVGVDLGELLAHAGALEPARAAAIAIDVARALAAAHAEGIVHRDVKPENVFLAHGSTGQRLKLLDFGFAWLAEDEPPPGTKRLREVVGTPAYMAPEQARGAVPRPSADVYALGIVLYEMLTGRVPFRGSYRELAERHARAPLPPLLHRRRPILVSPNLEAIVARALAKDASARYPDAGAVAEALSGIPERVGP